MTNEEAISIIENEIQIDVRLCTDEQVDKFQKALYKAIDALRNKTSGELLTIEQLREMDRPTPVWAEVVGKTIEGWDGYWCLCHRGKVLAPGRILMNADSAEGVTFYAYQPAYIDREAWTAEWRELHGDKMVGLDDCGNDVYKHYHYSVCTSCGKGSAVKSNFCQVCGKAMTPEAWAMMEKRLRG